VRIEVTGDDAKSPLPPRIKDALYRIGQEAIANSIRHGQPESIQIAFHRTRTHVVLTVTDDGKGYEASGNNSEESSGFGLLGMRKRAESIKANLHIESSPGRGTRVAVKAPTGPRLWPFSKKTQ
jgi:signal transduction histidine kinase